jgi:hypothetical protein
MMSAFDFYQRKIGSMVNTNSTGRNYPTLGEKLKSDSDMLMESTWSNDLQSKICYIYDYAHDNEPEKNKYMIYENTTKTRIDAKFIINSYGSIDKDQVAYHLMFKPSQPIDFVEGDELYYFETDYRKPLDIRFPVSLYIDIPDEKGVYYKWLICDFEESNQFMKYTILPCDYRFQWVSIENGIRVKRQMWGCTRSMNSYTAGTWVDRYFHTLDDVNKILLPLNSVTELFGHVKEDGSNQRVIMSAKIPKPLCWQITKCENTKPIGVLKATLDQDVFNEHTDYIERDSDGNIVAMYADYYTTDSSLTPTNPSDSTLPTTTNYSKITSSTSTIKIAGSYKTLTAKIYDNFDTEITDNYSSANFKWTCSVGDEDLTDTVTWLSNVNYNQIKIKFTDDRNYLGKTLDIKCVITNGNEVIETTAQFELIV